jgi:hypothetical protein
MELSLNGSVQTCRLLWTIVFQVLERAVKVAETVMFLLNFVFLDQQPVGTKAIVR